MDQPGRGEPCLGPLDPPPPLVGEREDYEVEYTPLGPPTSFPAQPIPLDGWDATMHDPNVTPRGIRGPVCPPTSHVPYEEAQAYVPLLLLLEQLLQLQQLWREFLHALLLF